MLQEQQSGNDTKDTQDVRSDATRRSFEIVHSSSVPISTQGTEDTHKDAKKREGRGGLPPDRKEWNFVGSGVLALSDALELQMTLRQR
jgi:hypothetical protein